MLWSRSILCFPEYICQVLILFFKVFCTYRPAQGDRKSLLHKEIIPGYLVSWSSRDPAPFLNFLKTWRWQTCQPSSMHYSFHDIYFTWHDSRGRVQKRECEFLFIMRWHCHKYCITLIACFSIAVWILVLRQKCFNFHWEAWTVWSTKMENFAYTVSNLCALHL